MMTVECIIPQEHHPTVLGSGDSKVKNVPQQFYVTIKLPVREKPEDADKVMVNEDTQANGLEAEFQASFEAQRDKLRKHAKRQIKFQDPNRKMYNLRRWKPKFYRVGDLVAIKKNSVWITRKAKDEVFRTLQDVARLKGENIYDVIKEGGHEGPNCTKSCAKYMKLCNMTPEF
ncbi:pro-Pol polyprotein [Nephila pilipes]|uniref:Pro-Pol polyprotein n=1 Tax=Nephila pilipes TaxID=299642 RepID=A0A8X6N7A3_NEPPI|nr:pro-Pol polyprotein [Nephila pilipes]